MKSNAELLAGATGCSARQKTSVPGSRPSTRPAMAAMYGTYQLYMLAGQTALDDPQNDRYPDIEPVTPEQLPAQESH